MASGTKRGERVFLNTEDAEGTEKSRRNGVAGVESRIHDP